MDIMMRLTGSGFSAIASEFRARERRLGGGLRLVDFVEIVLQGLPRARSAEDRAANVSALVDLFEDIDINGDGVMEFDELTSFCVDAGMVATRAKAASTKHRYVRDTRHVIKTANGSMGIEKVKWSPECRKFMVIEHAAKAVKLFTADGGFVAEVSVPAPIDSAAGSPLSSARDSGMAVVAALNDSDRASKSDELQGSMSERKVRTGSVHAASSAAATSIFVLDAVFVPKFHWLVMSTTDFCISFFDMDESRNAAISRVLPDAATAAPSASYELLKPLTITTTTAQLLLRFCAHSSLLVGSGNDLVVNIWRLVDSETKVLWKRLLTHQDMVMDVLEVPQHDLLVSCDLRRSIQLWESQNCRSRGALVGHTRGVRQMVYSSHHDLLLSAGFEFEAYAWDLGSRQVVMTLAGHRAPLVGVQLALFQTERAITADTQGVFKVWDISRASGVSGSATSSSSASRPGGGAVGSTTHAVQLESIEPALQFARFEPMTFVSLFPQSRDVWTSTAGSSTLHRFQSKRTQQFDEIPLSGFYHYNSNKFVVVAGSACSVWDGETGTCVEEFTHVGDVGAADSDRNSPLGGGDGGSDAGKGNNHSGAEGAQALEATSDVLVCAHDAKCRKLVVVSETGFLGVYNCLNFVQMRRCLERFNGLEAGGASEATVAMSRSASSRIVGLHYCSDNKLVIVTDAATAAIVVVDDNVSHDAASGAKRTPVLRRVINIPGGVSASAYSYHASLVATVAESDGMLVSLWDFETLTLVAQCQVDDDGGERGAGSGDAEGATDNRIQLLQFWDEFPVLFAADSHGRVFVFAAMPLLHAYAGKMLHVFVNSYSSCSSDSQADGQLADTERSSTGASIDVADPSSSASADSLAASVSDNNSSSATFITEAAESAAHKMLLRTRQKKSVSAATSHKGAATGLAAASESAAPAALTPPANDPSRVTIASAVTSMRVALDDAHDRYVLFSGDEHGHVAVWDLSAMAKQLSLTKIPDIKLKCLRRGYHAKATFSRDYAKEGKPTLPPREKRHHQPVFQGDWRRSMLLGEDLADMDVRAAQMDLKRLSKRRMETRRRPGTAAHLDAVTSIEVTRNPNVLVTCSLDTRVFVWDWRGDCLGKLFDAENAGRCRWRFHKNDAKRQQERDLVVRDILRELDRTPQEKLQRRRQTLYEEHVGRRSQAELQHVNAMLLDHLISKNPELEVMEKAAASTAAPVDGERPNSGALLSDAEINAALDGSRQRNQRAKLKMLATFQSAVGLSSKLKKPSGRSPNVLEVAARKQAALRIQSLSQVGPLLCVDRFSYRDQHAGGDDDTKLKNNARAATGATAPVFADHGDIRMDKAYLEQELAVSTDSTSLTVAGGDVTAVQDKIHAEHLAAEAAVQQRATLERKARELYANFEGVKRRLGKKKPPGLASASSSTSELLLGSTATLRPSDERLLEPSEFLKTHLPASALALRPQTAPLLRVSTPKSAKSRPVQLPSATPSPSSLVKQMPQHMTKRSASASTRLGLHGSESEPVLPASGVHASPPLPSSKRRSPSVAASELRKNSLDELFLGEVSRQSPLRLPPPLYEDSTFDPSGDSHAGVGAVDADVGGASPHLQHSSAKSSLRKLEGINDILSRVHSYSSVPSKEADSPATAAHAHVQAGEAAEDALATEAVDEEAVRQHLERTKTRMAAAMRDGEWSSSRHLLVKQQRQAAHRQKKARRIENYLQQKRREMNTGIGNVFKHTSFAFQSSDADAHAAEEGHSGRHKTVSSSSLHANGKANAANADGKSKPANANTNAKTKSTKQSAFGTYSAREVMSVIRLFWSMDEDASGSISLDELLRFRHFFDKLGHRDMATVFQAMDKDGNGHVSLLELLELCFPYATKRQLEEMLQLAKLGSVRSYLQGGGAGADGDGLGESSSGEASLSSTGQGAAARSLPAEHRRELQQIFRLFDADGDGGVSMQEIMEALRVDDDDVMATVMAKGSGRAVRGGHAATSGITRSDVEQIYREFDRDRDAVLDLDEFVALMRCLYGPPRASASQ